MVKFCKLSLCGACAILLLSRQSTARSAVPHYCGVTVAEMLKIHHEAYQKAGFKVLQKAMAGGKAWLTVSYQRSADAGFKHNIGFRFEPTEGVCMTAVGYVVEKTPKQFDSGTRASFISAAGEADKAAHAVVVKAIAPYNQLGGLPGKTIPDSSD